MPGVSKEQTPWAISCPVHGTVYLTEEEYKRQESQGLQQWICPIDREQSFFDCQNLDESIGPRSKAPTLQGSGLPKSQIKK